MRELPFSCLGGPRNLHFNSDSEAGGQQNQLPEAQLQVNGHSLEPPRRARLWGTAIAVLRGPNYAGDVGGGVTHLPVEKRNFRSGGHVDVRLRLTQRWGG